MYICRECRVRSGIYSSSAISCWSPRSAPLHTSSWRTRWASLPFLWYCRETHGRDLWLALMDLWKNSWSLCLNPIVSSFYFRRKCNFFNFTGTKNASLLVNIWGQTCDKFWSIKNLICSATLSSTVKLTDVLFCLIVCVLVINLLFAYVQKLLNQLILVEILFRLSTLRALKVFLQPDYVHL